MDFGANITPVKVIKKGAFGGAFIRDIYSTANVNGIKTHGKNLMS